MKKILLFAALFCCVNAFAQDVILKKDGSEIKAKVLEITDQQIKYKEYDFQSGPIRNINISDVFMITYENGQKEVFNKLTDTTPPSSKQQNATNCVKNNAFGLDLGIGGSFASIYGSNSRANFSLALGFRVTHHFNPYFGIDFLKINWITDVATYKIINGNYPYVTPWTPWTMRLQFMPGIRGNSPVFLKCWSVYAAFRLGYGMDFGEPNYEGLCLETELGLNFTPAVFAGFSYNYHRYFGIGYGAAMHALSFRLGFNIGK